MGEHIVTEQIVSGLGALLAAPIPDSPLVDVPAELVAAENEISHVAPGIAHGCFYVPNCKDSKGGDWIQHHDVAQNKERHVRLAILYGWVQSGDHQVLYELQKPELVWSADHGHFAVCRNGRAEPHPDIVRMARIGTEDLALMKPALQAIEPHQIASVAARPHESWGITIDRRISVAQHLEQKRVELIASLP